MVKRKCFLFLLIMLGFAVSANASLVTWTLYNADLSGGGRVEGWITYDTENRTIPDYHISMPGTTLHNYSDGYDFSLAPFVFQPSHTPPYSGVGWGPSGSDKVLYEFNYNNQYYLDLVIITGWGVDKNGWVYPTVLGIPGTIPLLVQIDDWPWTNPVWSRYYYVPNNGLAHIINPDAYITSEEWSPVPAPISLLLLGSGLAGLAAVRRRFKK